LRLLLTSCLLPLLAVTAMAAEPARKPEAAIVDAREAKAPPAFLLKTDTDLDALMAQGQQFAATNQHGSAIEVFQGVIEKCEERVVAETVENAVAGTARSFLPAAMAARQALLVGSKALRAEYAAQHEGPASALVDTAITAGDAAALSRTAARFPATTAAQRARWWCGAMLVDAGDFGAAAAVWDEFLALEPVLGAAGADLTMTLAQQSLALARSGQLGRARAVLARLEKESPAVRRRIGGSEQNVAEFTRRALVAAATATEEAALPGAFAPTARWRLQADTELAPMVFANNGRAFVRTLKSIACLEIATGKRLWEMPAPMQAMAQSVSSRSSVIGSSAEREVVGQQRFAVAATPEMVCFVENSPGSGANIEVRGMVVFGGPGPAMPQSGKFAGSSQLTARDARNGHLRWRVGQGEGRDEFSRVARWISPPAIVRDCVFVVALHIQSYHLVCLDAADGRLLWRSFISHRAEGAMGWQGLVELASASALKVTAGRVLCLTNGGVLACFDALTGGPRWFCQYGALVISGVNVMPPARLSAVNPILCHEQTAVILPADTDQVIAFDIATGRMLWRQPREQQRYLAGILAEKADAAPLVVLSGTSAAARSLEDGKVMWTKLLEGGAGRPVLRRGTLYGLTRGHGVVQLDARTGRELRSSQVTGGEFRHLAEAEGTLMTMGSRSLAALRSYDDAIGEITRRVEAAPEDPRRWRERGELNLQSARIAEAMEDLTKARALQQKARINHVETDGLLFRCHLEMAVREREKSLVWLERAAAFATTTVSRSERWLRVADEQEARENWTAACEALQQVLDHETAAWLDVPAGSDTTGARLAGGRVLNRSLAARRLEQLAATHGRAAPRQFETAVRKRLADAVKHDDAFALMEIIGSHPVGGAQEQAWLALAARHFKTQAFEEAAEVLLWFLRAEPEAARRGDAVLGVTLAGIRSGRGGLAKHGLKLLESLPPKTRVSFGGVSGAAAELRRTLANEFPATATREAGQLIETGVKSGREVSLLPNAGDLGGDRLFLESRRLVRASADGSRVTWASAEVTDKRGALDSSPVACVLMDTLVLFRGSQAVAFDADTGKLLWQERGVRLVNAAESLGSEVLQRLAMMGVAANRAAPGWRAMFVAGGQLLRLKTSGEVVSLAPRSGKIIWSARLPEPVSLWAAAAMKESGRYLTLVASAGNAAENSVAVLDLARGQTQAVWEVPKDRAEFSIAADGRAQFTEESGQK
jgi:outer membrane protein assembly factor BamB